MATKETKWEDLSNEEKGKLVSQKLAWYAFGGLLVIAVVLPFLVGVLTGGDTAISATVQPGFTGVLFNSFANRIDPNPLPVGFKIKMPWETVYQVETRTMKTEAKADAASKDLQTVVADVAINSHIEAVNAPRIYTEIGPDYQNRIVSPALQESVKAATARYDASNLIIQREQVKEEIVRELRSRLTKYAISLDEVNIINFAFSSSYEAAIEAKVKVEQERQKTQLELEQVKIEAQKNVTIARAQAEATIATANGTAMALRINAEGQANATLLNARAQAEALRLQREQLTPELIQLRTAEWYAGKWNGVMPQYVLGSAMPFIQIPQAGPAVNAQ